MTSIQVIILIAAFLHLLVQIVLKYLDLVNTLRLRGQQPKETVSLMNEQQWIKTSDYTVSKTKLSLSLIHI